MARYTLIASEATPIPNAVSGGERLITCDVQCAAPVSPKPNSTLIEVFEVLVDGSVTRATVLDAGPPLLFSIDGRPCEVVEEAPAQYRVVSSGVTLLVAASMSKRSSVTTNTPSLLAPMPGRVVRVLCQAGDVVKAGAPLIVLEAMKMENELIAPTAGRVAEVFVQEGTAVEARARLVTLAEA